MAVIILSKMGLLTSEKQKYQCQNCQRQFVENSQINYISNETKELIDKLFLEKISKKSIIRVTGVSSKWLYDYVNNKYFIVYRSIKCTKKKPGKLTIQCDEMWSFIGNKNNKQWLWLAIDIETR